MASKGVNKVIILGRLGQDPEMRSFPNGGEVANLSVVTSESWRDKQSGEERERAEWHRVAIFGKLAEIAGQYLKKGSQVYIEGALQTRKWQDQSGADRYTTEVVVQGFSGVLQMIGSNNQASDNPTPKVNTTQQAAKPAQQGGYNQPARQPDPSPQQGFNDPISDFDDDIPF